VCCRQDMIVEVCCCGSPRYRPAPNLLVQECETKRNLNQITQHNMIVGCHPTDAMKLSVWHCLRVLQCGAVWMCYNVLQCVIVGCHPTDAMKLSVWHCVLQWHTLHHIVCCSAWQCVALYCVCCSAVQCECVIMCCSVCLQVATPPSPPGSCWFVALLHKLLVRER